MELKTKRGLALLLTIAVVISICNSSYNYVIANTERVYATEKEIVSLRTISSVLAEAPIATAVAITTSPEAMTIEPEKEEKFHNETIVIAMETPKLQKIEYLSLKEVRKRLHKDMDLSKPSRLSKKAFVKLVHNMKYDYTGVFKRNAEYIWILARKNHFNSVFFLGIIANESEWGKDKSAIANNNYTGQKKHGKLISYKSERECLKATARNLGKNYLRKNGKYYSGVTLYAVNEEYCDPYKHKDGTPYKYKWADDVYGCMKMILRK